MEVTCGAVVADRCPRNSMRTVRRRASNEGREARLQKARGERLSEDGGVVWVVGVFDKLLS
jgi:hypothetical protein